MKTASSALLTTLLLVSGAAGAKESASSPIFGTWEVDVSRLPMPPEARPRQVEISFRPVSTGRVSTHVSVTTADGNTLVSDSDTDLSGTPAKATGNLEADTVSTTLPLPQVLVMQLSLNGHPGSTRIYAVQPGGQTMTETAANYDDRGIPYTRINYFHRKRPTEAAPRATAIGSVEISAPRIVHTLVRVDPQQVPQPRGEPEAAR